MRRKDKEITDIKEIEDTIKRASVCRLGMVDGDEPYIVPLSFGYEKNALYFHWALEGRKLEVIKRNNKVCFEVDIDVAPASLTKKGCGGYYCHTQYRSVIGVGRAYILENAEEKAHGLGVLVRHYYSAVGKPYSESDCDFSQKNLDSVLVVKVEIDSLTGKKSGY